MASTYDRRKPAYVNEGRLSRVKSGSTGTLYNRQSSMSNNYSSTHGYSRLQVTRDEDYIYAWCHHYGLTPATARVLAINGIESADDLLRLDRHTVNQMTIKDNEKLLFRGALLQFKQSDYETARRQAAKGLRPILIDRNHGISEEERQNRMQLRARLRRKKIQNNGGLSLADRILMQRRDANSSLSEPVVGTTLFLPSIDQSDMVSSRSLRSYTDPTPRRTSVASKTSDYSSGSGLDSTETPQKVVKKKKEPIKRADSSDDEEEKPPKKDKKKKKKQESDSEEEEEKPKKSKKKKDKVNSDTEDEDREVKKKKKKKKKSKDNESEEEGTEKKSKKKKEKYDQDDSDEDASEIKKKKKKEKKRKEEEESDVEETKREKKKKKKDRERDQDSDGEEKEKKKKKKKDKDPSDSEDEDEKRERKKKKKKKKKERQDSDDE